MLPKCSFQRRSSNPDPTLILTTLTLTLNLTTLTLTLTRTLTLTLTRCYFQRLSSKGKLALGEPSIAQLLPVEGSRVRVRVS